MDAVEIYNPINLAVDIGYWYLTDDFGSPKKYRFLNQQLYQQTVISSFTKLISILVLQESRLLLAQMEISVIFSADENKNLTGYYHALILALLRKIQHLADI
jgi:hypothetical protein